MINMARGRIVFSAGLALALAQSLLEHHYGGDELVRQRPLSVSDEGDYWRIEGNSNRDHLIEGVGPFFLSIYKFDGRIVDLGVTQVLHPHPDVAKIIEEHRRLRGDGTP